jgi:hypothetical protein
MVTQETHRGGWISCELRQFYDILQPCVASGIDKSTLQTLRLFGRVRDQKGALNTG